MIQRHGDARLGITWWENVVVFNTGVITRDGKLDLLCWSTTDKIFAFAEIYWNAGFTLRENLISISTRRDFKFKFSLVSLTTFCSLLSIMAIKASI
jgi:hypothetical protein